MAAAAGANTYTTLAPVFTEQYADKIVVLPPDVAILTEMAPFQKSKKTGKFYHQPVDLSFEQGVCLDSTGDAFDLTDPGPIAATMGDAQVQASSIVLPTRISYAAISRAEGGVKQFVKSIEKKIESNAMGLAHAIETSHLYGQSGVCTANSIAASGTSGTFIVDAATWAPGWWYGSIGRALDLYAAIGDAAKINTTAAIFVTGVTFSTRTVAFSCASGDAAAIDAMTVGTVFRRNAKTGASAYAESVGVDKIATQASGNLFNIATTDPLWHGQSKDCGSAPLNLAKINGGFQLVANVGASGKYTLLCSPAVWSDLAAELAAQRMYDASYNSTELKAGSNGVKYFTQGLEINVVRHRYIWQGVAYGVPMDGLVRIGSAEPQYRVPGFDEVLFPLPTHAGAEFRSYTDQALFSPLVASFLKFTSITPTNA